MNILVTGGAGFIGSQLADGLIREGHRVVIVDNETTGRSPNVPVEAVYIKGDVTRFADLELAFAQEQIGRASCRERV